MLSLSSHSWPPLFWCSLESALSGLFSWYVLVKHLSEVTFLDSLCCVVLVVKWQTNLIISVFKDLHFCAWDCWCLWHNHRCFLRSWLSWCLTVYMKILHGVGGPDCANKGRQRWGHLWSSSAWLWGVYLHTVDIFLKLICPYLHNPVHLCCFTRKSKTNSLC